MITSTFSTLLITNDQAKKNQIKHSLKQSDVFLWKIDWVNNFNTAFIAHKYKTYDAIIIDCSLDQVMTWVDLLEPIPVILITSSSSEGIKALNLGVADYWLAHQLDSPLLEHSLRLAIVQSQTNKNFQECQSYYKALYHQNLEQKLTEPEILLNTIFENIPNGLLIVDRQGIIRFVNKSATILFDKPLHNLVGYEFGIPIFIQNSTELQIIQAYNKIKTVQIYIGNTQWHEEDAFVIIIVDITQQKKDEFLLKEKEKQYRTLVNNLPGAVYRCAHSETWEGMYISDEIEKIVAYPAQDFFANGNRDYASIIYPEDQEQVNQLVEASLKQNQPFTLEYRVVTKTGQIKWVWERGQGIFDKKGKLLYIDGVILDITSRKHMEDELAENNEKLKLITDHVPALISYIDQDTRYQFVNQYYEEIFHKNKQDILGKTIAENLGDSYTIIQDHVVQALQGNKVSYEHYYPNFWGEEKYFKGEFVPHFVQEKVVGFFTFVIDITKEKLAERELQKYQNNLEQLVQEQTQSLLESEQKNKALLNAIPDLIFRIHRDGTYLDYYVQNLEDLYVDPSVFMGKKFTDLMPPKLAQKAAYYHEKAFTENKVQTFEYELLMQGKPHYYENRLIANGKDEVFCIIRDITEPTIALQEKEKAQQALQASEELYRILLSSISDAVFIVDDQGNFTFICDNVHSIFGYNFQEVGTMANIDQLIDEDQLNLGQLKLQPEITNLEVAIQDKYGQNHIILINLKSVQIQAGTILITCHDITELKATAKALGESEKRYEDLVNILPVGIFQNDAQGNCIYVNNKLLEMMGITFAQCQNRGWMNYIHPDDQEFMFKTWTEAQKHQDYFQLEYRLLRPDRRVVWIYAQALFDRDEQGQIIKSFGSITDISDRKETELALQKSEETFRLVAEQTYQLIYDYNITTGQIKWDGAISEITGYDAQEFQEINIQRWEKLIHPEDRSKAVQIIEDAIQYQRQYCFEYRFQHQDGHYIYIEDRGVSIHHSENIPSRMVGVMNDITARKKAELALQESETRFREMVEHIEESFWVNPPDPTKVTYISPGYEKIWGRTCESLLENGDSWIESVYPEDRQGQIKALQEMAQGKDFREEYRIVRPDGEIRWVFARSYKIFDEDGNLLRHVGIAEDITQRKQAEERLLTAQRIARLGNWDWNLITNDIYWSDEVYRIFGQDPESFKPTYQSFLNCVHPDDQHLIIDNVSQVLETGIVPDLDYRIVLPNGEIRIVHEQGNMIFNQEQKPTHLIGAVQDITERKQAEQAIKDSENRLEEAQTIAHIGSWEYSLHTQEMQWSKELYRLHDLEISSSPPTLTKHLKRIHPEDLIKAKPLILRAINEGIPYQFDYRILLPNGSIRYAEAKGKPIFNADGQIIKVFGTVLDITQRKQAEIALQESEQRFRIIFEQAGIGISICNLGGQFLQVNSTLAEIVGYSIVELLERNIYDITGFKYHLPLKQKLRQLILGRVNAITMEKYYICRDGSLCWVNTIISLISDAQGNPKNLIYIVEDITDSREAKNQLEKAKEKAELANQAKSQFLANMSHELRTPLNAILGFTQLMSRANQLSETHQEYLQIINRSGDHLLSLINDILDLSKIEAGQLELFTESFNLLDFLAELQQMFSLKAMSKDLQLNFQLAPQLPTYIKCDKKKLRSILINLMGNAIKFTEQGEITVKINSETSPCDHQDLFLYHIIFEIRDTGIGISPNEIEHLFEAFVQSSSSKKQAEGTGLGLAISKHFVEMMGGQISVQSTVGIGSLFTFDINCESACQSEIGTIPPQYRIIGLDLEPDQAVPRILIFEDQFTNLQLLLSILQPLGFDIQSAENGEIGLKIWEQWHPDLILMDIRMPVMDGYEATKAIRLQESLRNSEISSLPIPIIALTASVLDSQRELLLEIGCNDFIPKPLDENKLLEKIALYLNIRYLYEEITQNAVESSYNHQTKINITPDDLAMMSPAWKEQLKIAALSARDKQIVLLIEQIPAEYEAIKHRLIELVNHLNYAKIADLVNSKIDNQL